jgi:RNA polymerase sigma-32 factor
MAKASLRRENDGASPSLPAPIPVLSPEGGLKRYLQEIKTFPVLSAEEEYMLAKRWKEHGDVAAAHRLATSHLRLVAKTAFGYRGYGLPVGDLIAEGNIGMMQAIKRFDPERGFRFATYAIWWIKAAMQEYVLKSWSMVKVGTSAMQKKLFFNLKKLKRKLGMEHVGELTPEGTEKIAELLDVGEQDVTDMNRRLIAHDRSLDAKIGGEDGEGSQWIDFLADDSDNQETLLGEQQELARKRNLFRGALAGLTQREQEILLARRMSEEPPTLEELSGKYNVSRERIRQIEEAALKKVQKRVAEDA